MSAGFTPGPWVFREGGSYCGDTGRFEVLTSVANEWVIAATIGDVEQLYPHEEANAKLIASAPELYEALSRILNHPAGMRKALADKAVFAFAMDALAKAGGERNV